MHIWVVYESKLGNTAHLARAIAEALSVSSRVQLLEAEKANSPYHVDLILIGWPAHRRKEPEAVQAWLAKLPANGLAGIWLGVFDIRYRKIRIFQRSSSAVRLVKHLQQLGGRLASRPQSYHLLSRGGPLSDAEFRRGVHWALLLEQRLSRKNHLPAADANQPSVMAT